MCLFSSNRWTFFSNPQISSFIIKIFGNIMCQTWSKALENEGLRELYRGFALLWSVNTFISEVRNTKRKEIYITVFSFFLDAVYSARQDNAEALDNLKKKLASINNNILYLENRQHDLEGDYSKLL